MLEQVGPIRAAVQDIGPAEPRALRRRALSALRTLLIRLAQRQLLALHVDDLQWGDADSGCFLRDLLSGPSVPPLLLLVSYRSGAEGNALGPLLELERPASPLQVQRLLLDPLDDRSAVELAAGLLGRPSSEPGPLARWIAQESSGVPRFARELAAYATERGDDADAMAASPPTLEALLQRRCDRLSPRARILLEHLAIAGYPLRWSLLQRVVGGVPWLDLARLRTEGLMQTREEEDGELILECSQDRVRRLLVRSMSDAARRDLHRSLLEALFVESETEPDHLLQHVLGAGVESRADAVLRAAADRATSQLAFERAARLFQLAAQRLEPGTADWSELQERQAQALQNAGHGSAAAEAYLRATQGRNDVTAVVLRGRAAHQCMRCGHLDRGHQVIGELLAELGIRAPRSGRLALLALAWQRLRLWLRGLSFQERDPAEIPQVQLAELDALWTVGMGLSMADPVRAAVFQSRFLRAALDTGDPTRIARALATEAGFISTGGSARRGQVAVLLDRAQQLAERTHDSHALGTVGMIRAVAAFQVGSWRECQLEADRAESLLSRNNPGGNWELQTAIIYRIAALAHQGHLRQVRVLYDESVQDARERGDRHVEVLLRLGLPIPMALLDDYPDAAEADIEDALALWDRPEFDLRRGYAVLHRCRVLLYRGQAEEAWQALERARRPMKRSLGFRVQLVRILFHELRGRLALAQHGGARRTAMLAALKRDIRLLLREAVPWAKALAHLLEAQLIRLRGDEDVAIRRLREVSAELEALGMQLHANVAQLGLELADAQRTRTEISSTEPDLLRNLLRAEGIAKPDRIAKLVAPGLPLP